MLINFTKNFQFSTRLQLEGKNIDIVSETKLLGVIITNDLKWSKNTNFLVKKAFSRMRLMHKISEFKAPISDMVTIYISFIRSLSEQACEVWHSSLTTDDSDDLERIQKVALKIMLAENYNSYEHALQTTNLEKLSVRREKLCLNFAHKCLKNQNTQDMFPINPVRENLVKGKNKINIKLPPQIKNV